MYNRFRCRKINDRKVLHKVKKRWVVVSAAVMAALGTGALAAQTTVHADSSQTNHNSNSRAVNTKEPVNHILINDPNTKNSLKSNSQSAPSSSSSSANPTSAVSSSQDQIKSQANQLHTNIISNTMNQMKMNPESSQNNNEQNQNNQRLNQNVSQELDTKPVSSSLGDTKDDSVIWIKSEDITNHQMVHNDETPIYGYNGETFTQAEKQSYMKLVPNGYTPANIVQDVNTFSNVKPQDFIIGVRPVKSRQPGHDIVIRYINDSKGGDSGHIIGQTVFGVGDPVGTPFNIQDYIYNIPDPNTYSFSRVITGNNVNSLQSQNQFVLIGLVNKSQAPKNATMHIQYMNGSQQVSDESTTKAVGTPFHIMPYEQHIPSGYTFAGYNDNVPKQYINGWTMTINVKPIISSDKMTVNYVDSSNGQLAGSEETNSGKDGSHFDLSFYENNVPRGYIYNKVISGNTNVYLPHNHTIVISVSALAKMNVTYLDSNNHIAGYAQPSGPSGSSFDITPYTKSVSNGGHMPNGYRVVSIGKVPDTYQNGDGITIRVQSTTPSSNISMPIIYWNQKSNSEVTQTNASGQAGTPVNIIPYIEKTPSGYNFVSIKRSSPTVYQNGQSITLYVVPANEPQPKPKPQPKPQPHLQNTKMTVDYLDNGQVVYQTSTTGNIGQKFNVAPYEKNVSNEGYLPNIYRFVDVQASPSVYTKNTKVLINVRKLSNPSHTTVTMPIHYINSDNQIVGRAYIKGTDGNAFLSRDLQPYLNDLPYNYDKPQVENMPSVYRNGTLIKIKVQKIHQVQTGQIIINYVNSDNQPVGTPTDVKGQSGDNFDINQSMKIPAGYSFKGVEQNVSKFTAGVQNATVQVTKVSPKQTQGQIVIHYVDSNNQPVGTPQVTDGNIGTAFSSNDYKGVPSDYHVVKDLSGNVTVYTKDPQSVNIEVAKNQKPSQPADINVEYLYENKVIGSKTVPGTSGEAFDVDPYEEGVPSGYKFADLASTLPKVFNGQQQLLINVVPLNSPNQPQTGLMTIYYVTVNNNIVNTINHRNISGKDGDALNLNQYENEAPQNYHAIQVLSHPDNFNVGSSIEILVAANRSNNHPSGPNNPINPNPNPNPVTPNNNGGNGNNNNPYSPNSNPVTPNNNGGNGNNNNPYSPNSNPVTPNNNGSNNSSHPSSSHTSVTPNGGNGNGNSTEGNVNRGDSAPNEGANSNDNEPYANNASLNDNHNYHSNVNNNNNNGKVANNVSNSNNNRELPQTGENIDRYQIGKILASLGMALSALGYALEKKHRRDI